MEPAPFDSERWRLISTLGRPSCASKPGLVRLCLLTKGGDAMVERNKATSLCIASMGGAS